MDRVSERLHLCPLPAAFQASHVSLVERHGWSGPSCLSSCQTYHDVIFRIHCLSFHTKISGLMFIYTMLLLVQPEKQSPTLQPLKFFSFLPPCWCGGKNYFGSCYRDLQEAHVKREIAKPQLL